VKECPYIAEITAKTRTPEAISAKTCEHKLKEKISMIKHNTSLCKNSLKKSQDK
jgi:hypothetical protein